MKTLNFIISILFASAFIACAPDIMHLNGYDPSIGEASQTGNTPQMRGSLINKSGTAITYNSTTNAFAKGWIVCTNDGPTYGSSSALIDIYSPGNKIVLSQTGCSFYAQTLTVNNIVYTFNGTTGQNVISDNNGFNKLNATLEFKNGSNTINVKASSSGINPISTSPSIDFAITETTVNSTTSTALTTGTRLPSVGTGDGFSCSLDYATPQSLNCWGQNANIVPDYTKSPNTTLTKNTNKTKINLTAGSKTITATELYVGNELICVTDNSVAVQLYCLGNWTGTITNTFTKIILTGSVQQVALGHMAGCAVTSNSATSVQCWGTHSLTALNTKTVTSESSPVTLPTFGGTITGLAFGSDINNDTKDSICAIAGGIVKCLGDNSFGQLGNSNGNISSNYTSAQATTGLTGTPTAITAKNHTYCTTTSTPATFCWGQQNDFVIGNNTFEFNIWGALGSGTINPIGGGSLYSTPLINSTMYKSNTGGTLWTAPAYSPLLTSPLKIDLALPNLSLGLGTLCGSNNYTSINCIGTDILNANIKLAPDSSSKILFTNINGVNNKVTTVLTSDIYYNSQIINSCTTKTWNTSIASDTPVFETFNSNINSCDTSIANYTLPNAIYIKPDTSQGCNTTSCSAYTSPNNSFKCTNFAINELIQPTAKEFQYWKQSTYTSYVQDSTNKQKYIKTDYANTGCDWGLDIWKNTGFCAGNYEYTKTITNQTYQCTDCQYSKKQVVYTPYSAGPQSNCTNSPSSSTCSATTPANAFYKIGTLAPALPASCTEVSYSSTNPTPSTYNHPTYTNISVAPTPPSTVNSTSIYSISMGVNLQSATPLSHGCAVLIDGTINCWGNNEFGQAVPSNTATVISTPTAP